MATRNDIANSGAKPGTCRQCGKGFTRKASAPHQVFCCGDHRRAWWSEQRRRAMAELVERADAKELEAHRNSEG